MLRVFEAFAGYGSQSIALRNLGIEHEVVAISEIDKYAIKAYEAIHGPTNNLGDICKIDPKDIPDHDLFTYSFPCQDLSVAGKQAAGISNTQQYKIAGNSIVVNVLEAIFKNLFKGE